MSPLAETGQRSGARPAAGDLPRRVALFPTCMADLATPEPALAAARVLRLLGCDVETPRAMACCGQPALNSGHPRPAARLMERWLESAEGYDAVVTIAGSCAATIVEHGPRLLGPAVRGRVGHARLWEFCQFLDEFAPDLPLQLEGAATYHDSCHMTRLLGERSAPRAVLSRVVGLELVEMPGAADCCGFGGTFSLKCPETAVAMADQKLRHARATGVDYLVSADPGCLAHLRAREAAGAPAGPTPIHVAEIVDLAARRAS